MTGPDDGRSPEERARAKRTHATVMMILGAVTVASGLAAAYVSFAAPGAIPAALYPWRWVRRAAMLFGAGH